MDKMLLGCSLGTFRQLIVTFKAAAKAGLQDLADQAKFLKESKNILSSSPVQSLCPISPGPSVPPVPGLWHQDHSTLDPGSSFLTLIHPVRAAEEPFLQPGWEHTAPLLKHLSKSQFPT